MIDVWIPGRPTSWKRAARNGRYSYTDPKMLATQQSLVAQVLAKTGPMMPAQGPVSVSLQFVFAQPKTKAKRNATWVTSRPDLDNLLKLVLDALNGIAYVDDAQVVSLCAAKRYGAEAGIMIRVGPPP